MPSSHHILCRHLLLLPPIPPSIRVFSNESTLCMTWPKYWSFTYSIPTKACIVVSKPEGFSIHSINIFKCLCRPGEETGTIGAWWYVIYFYKWFFLSFIKVSNPGSGQTSGLTLSYQEASIRLLSLSIRGRQNENYKHRKLIKLITWTTALFNSVKLWAMQCRAIQNGWVMVESSDKTWSTREGNGKPLKHSCLENPMKVLLLLLLSCFSRVRPCVTP